MSRMFDMYETELKEKGMVQFYVRALPGAPKTLVSEYLEDGSVKVRIAAPPEGGKANAELLRFIAKKLHVDRSQVSLISGVTSRMKLIRIQN